MIKATRNIDKIVLGTAQFTGSYGLNEDVGRLTQDEECLELLSVAANSDLRKLDTAFAYGKSHRIILAHLAQYRHFNYQITTKANLESNDEAFNVMEFLAAENISKGTVLMHKQTQIFNEDLVKKIRLLVARNNRVDWGLSTYDLRHGEKALATDGCASIQVPVSLLNQDFIHSGFIDHAKTEGIKVVGRSIYTLGIIFRDEKFWREYPKSVREMLAEIISFSNRHQIPISSIALRFVLNKANVDEVIIGVNSTEQLINNISDDSHCELDGLLSYCSEQSKHWDSRMFRPELWA